MQATALLATQRCTSSMSGAHAPGCLCDFSREQLAGVFHQLSRLACTEMSVCVVCSLPCPSLPPLSVSLFSGGRWFPRSLWKQIWFPCMATEPIEIVTVNIGPETGLGGGTHDTEFYAPTPLNMGLLSCHSCFIRHMKILSVKFEFLTIRGRM